LQLCWHAAGNPEVFAHASTLSLSEKPYQWRIGI
jgi:hypothetical protein